MFKNCFNTLKQKIINYPLYSGGAIGIIISVIAFSLLHYITKIAINSSNYSIFIDNIFGRIFSEIILRLGLPGWFFMLFIGDNFINLADSVLSQYIIAITANAILYGVVVYIIVKIFQKITNKS